MSLIMSCVVSGLGGVAAAGVDAALVCRCELLRLDTEVLLAPSCGRRNRPLRRPI
jgi:hypothetical protein